MEENFPHFIADKPQGVDVFEGQSQTRLEDWQKAFLIIF